MSSFPIPQGFEIPDGTEEGDTFEAMAQLRLDAGGKLTLVSLDGCDCEGGEEEEDDEGEDEGPEDAAQKDKSFVNQVEIKFGSAGLD